MSYLSESPLPSPVPKKVSIGRKESPIQSIEQAKNMLSEKNLSSGFRAKAISYLVGQNGLKSTHETTIIHAICALKSPNILNSIFLDKLVHNFEKNPNNAKVVEKANDYLAQILAPVSH